VASAKYPRTYHFDFSPGVCCDDKVMESSQSFINKELTITEKLDGGSCCLCVDGVFARTHGSIANHPSFDPIKAMWSSIQHDIPKDWSIYGESMYAKHSIHYKALTSYFLTFNMKIETTGEWLSWNDVKGYSDALGLSTVPELWSGTVTSEKALRSLCDHLMKDGSRVGGDNIEGLVVRDARSFYDFETSVGKIVRKNHIQTDEHWTTQKIVPNLLKI
jgi:RNA ligase